MANTNRMQWPYPDRDVDPWYERFDQMVTAQDSSGYASREDRHLMFSGGGTVSFDAATGLVSWDAAIEMLSPIAGFKITMAASSITLLDGQIAYIDLTRSPTQNIVVVPTAAYTAPNTDNAYTILARNGDSVYWANGSRTADGESKPLYWGVLPGSTSVEVAHIAGRASHNSDTPLVVGGIAFDPTDYDKPGYSRVLNFRAVAANGDIGITTSVKLFNVTDGEEIAALAFTTTDMVKDEVVLVEGGGVGEVDLAEKIYEVQISLDAPPGSATETVELYVAEIQVVSTAI